MLQLRHGKYRLRMNLTHVPPRAAVLSDVNEHLTLWVVYLDATLILCAYTV